MNESLRVPSKEVPAGLFVPCGLWTPKHSLVGDSRPLNPQMGWKVWDGAIHELFICQRKLLPDDIRHACDWHPTDTWILMGIDKLLKSARTQVCLLTADL